jgi:aspartyl-tRNA(Asn)/glutamyl-tRNA(Gln) amidotransferase subunit A
MNKKKFYTWSSIGKLRDSVLSGESTARSFVEESLRRIDELSDYDTIIAKCEDRALKRADEIDSLVKKGSFEGKLAGVPFIAKDNLLVFGAKTTAASNMLRDFEAPYQATAIEKLEQEGAICVAKANLDAFAHGSSTENSDFMVTKNPHNKKLVPGGTSGGSAAAVVLGLAPFALGTDTGGSIRQPASFCGAVGLKPSYGAVSRNGAIAMISSTDVIGPLTTNVADAALVLDCMAGKDPQDSTTVDRDEKGYFNFKKYNPKNIKVGYIKECNTEGLSAEVKQSIDQAIKVMKNGGIEVDEVSLPSLPLALACYYILCPAEVSSNLARYDGIRYGYSHNEYKDLEDWYKKSRTYGFGREAKRRIMIGNYVLSSGYYDAYYKKAQKLRTKIIKEFEDAYKKFDFLISPTAPTTAFEIGKNTSDPLEMYLQDVMTVSASLAGIPALSIPSIVDKDSLPIGLQIMARHKGDRELLAFANYVEELL